VVTVHCPRTEETLGMLGADAFSRMRRGALFVSTARGGIQDENALAAAMASGQVGGAALDVWAAEPPPADHPLMRFPNFIATPHTAGATAEARHHTAEIAAEQVIDILDGKRPPRLINPEVWPAFSRRFSQIFGVAPAGGMAA
jgi:D-3-phosphoglycerate dehydrogenase